MARRSHLAAHALAGVVEAVPQNRRRGHRQRISNLAYVKLGASNGGVLRDVSEFGIAMQTLSPLRQEQEVHVQLDLPNPRLHLEALGRVAWSDSEGQAGVEFGDLPPRSVRLLKEWLFTQVLADAHRAGGDAELLFSSAVRAPIRLQPMPSLMPRAKTVRPLRMRWFALSARKFSRVVDGLVLLCAVLLFSLLSLIMTDTLPSWPLAVVFVVSSAAIFAGLYWLLFAGWFGTTPGTRLAELAGIDSGKGKKPGPVERMRFR